MAATPALNMDGKVVAVGDSVTIIARATSHTGTGSTASITATTILNDSITVPANNSYSLQHDTGSLYGIAGKQYGDTHRMSIPGAVTAVSGLGQIAQLTVKLVGGTSVTVSAGACHSTSQS